MSIDSTLFFLDLISSLVRSAKQFFSCYLILNAIRPPFPLRPLRARVSVRSGVPIRERLHA